MDTTEAIIPVATPTDVINATDLHAEVVSTETMNGTKLVSGTVSIQKDEPIDFMPILADWAHGKNLPSFKSIFVGIAVGANIFVDYFLDYFLWRIMFTLVTVEAPQIVVPAPWTDKRSDEDEAPPQVQQERSITKSLRTTVRHLYGVGGPFAMCRGLALHISLHIAAFAIATPMFMFWMLRSFGKEDEEPVPKFSEMALSARLKSISTGFAFEIAGNLIFCSWVAAWVHIVITQHTLRVWYRRLPPFMPTFRATWRPLVILPLVDIILRDTMVVLLKHSMDLYSTADTTKGTFTSRNMLLTLVWLLSQAIHVLVTLPLEVALVRIQASLLSEDEEPIVPLDRSFGNNGPNGLRPGLLAETRGPLSLKEAWRSLTWTEMRRLLKIFAKMLAVQAVVNAVFWLAIGNKAWPQHWVPTWV